MSGAGLGRAARFALTVATLMALWLVLSGRPYGKYLAIGAVGSVLIALAVFPWQQQRPFPLLRFARFVPWHLLQVVISNLRVAKVAMSRQARIEPQFILVDPDMQDERALATLGCAVTLTPGTLTVDIDSKRALIHALDARSARDIEEGIMAQRVKRVYGPS